MAHYPRSRSAWWRLGMTEIFKSIHFTFHEDIEVEFPIFKGEEL